MVARRLRLAGRDPIRAALAAVMATALAAALAGCEETPVTSVAFRIEDPWAIAQGAMPLPVVVVGSAFATVPPPLVAERLVATMAEAITWNRHARFVLVPAADADAGLRIVVALNGATADCRPAAGPAPAAAPPAPAAAAASAGGYGRLSLRALFCDGERPLAAVDGRVGGSDGPGDRRFLALVRQVTGELLRPPPAPRP